MGVRPCQWLSARKPKHQTHKAKELLLLSLPWFIRHLAKKQKEQNLTVSLALRDCSLPYRECWHKCVCAFWRRYMPVTVHRVLERGLTEAVDKRRARLVSYTFRVRSLRGLVIQGTVVFGDRCTCDRCVGTFTVCSSRGHTLGQNSRKFACAQIPFPPPSHVCLPARAIMLTWCRYLEPFLQTQSRLPGVPAPYGTLFLYQNKKK